VYCRQQPRFAFYRRIFCKRSIFHFRYTMPFLICGRIIIFLRNNRSCLQLFLWEPKYLDVRVLKICFNSFRTSTGCKKLMPACSLFQSATLYSRKIHSFVLGQAKLCSFAWGLATKLFSCDIPYNFCCSFLFLKNLLEVLLS
jgi:hypothetical protein